MTATRRLDAGDGCGCLLILLVVLMLWSCWSRLERIQEASSNRKTTTREARP